MIWIPITIWAAFAQTVRNAAQRSLVTDLGTLGATMVRFFYGVPFAALWLLLVWGVVSTAMPAPNPAFIGWVFLGGISQILGTSFLLQTMGLRNFAVGVAYSKTEVVQIAIFALVFIGDPLSLRTVLAVASGSAGVILLTPADPKRPLRSMLEGLTSRAAFLGLGCGACFAIGTVAFRGAILALDSPSFLLAAAYSLVASQILQSILLGAWLLVRQPGVIMRVLKAWRASLFAGFMGAAASAGWFTAFAIEPVTHVRTLGLIEIVFSYAVSRRFFREHLTRRELTGMALLALAVVIITLL
ncbi:MAG: DMT family transporter [Casimicrobiaceae bacterium]